MRWPWNERRDRERDLTEFVWWLSREKGVKLGLSAEPPYIDHPASPFLLQRVGTHGFHEEHRLVAEFLEASA